MSYELGSEVDINTRFYMKLLRIEGRIPSGAPIAECSCGNGKIYVDIKRSDREHFENHFVVQCCNGCAAREEVLFIDTDETDEMRILLAAVEAHYTELLSLRSEAFA